MEWQALRSHLIDLEDKIERGEPIETVVSNRQTFERKYVKAIMSSSPDKLPGADKLWMRDFQGKVEPEPWAIKIIEELPPPHKDFL